MKERLESHSFVDAAAELLGVLESFSNSEEEVSITEVARRTGLTYNSAFRPLYTLEKRGYVNRRSGRKRYSLTQGHHRYRIGYASCGNARFTEEVSWSIVMAARKAAVTLLTKNNEFNPSAPPR